MSGAISSAENELVNRLKEDRILTKFKPKQIASYGGVAVICSDGDIDAEPFHRRISSRPHAVKVFGGPLLLAPNFGGYDKDFAQKIIENIKKGMRIKETNIIYLYFHAPCGAAEEYNHTIPDILKMAQEVENIFEKIFYRGPGGAAGRVFTFFHVRMHEYGYDRQKTYLCYDLCRAKVLR